MSDDIKNKTWSLIMVFVLLAVGVAALYIISYGAGSTTEDTAATISPTPDKSSHNSTSPSPSTGTITETKEPFDSTQYNNAETALSADELESAVTAFDEDIFPTYQAIEIETLDERYMRLNGIVAEDSQAWGYHPALGELDEDTYNTDNGIVGYAEIISSSILEGSALEDLKILVEYNYVAVVETPSSSGQDAIIYNLLGLGSDDITVEEEYSVIFTLAYSDNRWELYEAEIQQ